MSAADPVEPDEEKQVGRFARWFDGLFVPKSRPTGMGARPRRWLSALTVQVLLFNIGALVLFVVGVYWVQAVRVSLAEERVKSLMAQAEIVSAALARYAAKGDVPEDEDAATDIDANKAADVLKLLVGPTGMRARVFSRAGEPLQDTRFILTRNQVTVTQLPPPGQIDVLAEIERGVKQNVYALRPGKDLPPVVNDDPQQSGRNYEEVRKVLEKGEPGSAERINAEGNLIVSVAVPIRRLQFIMGVLMLSTEAGDIDDALRQEWLQLLLAAVIAFLILAAASGFLLYHVTGPVRALSDGADAVRRGERQLSVIPNLASRADEIGDLSVSLRSMTSALYARMDAIEQFAADVAHEIKNPLTSVGSAIETLQRTSDEEKRRKLMSVVRDDVRRLDKLITDIADASRLDAELSRERAADVDIAGLIGAMTQMFDDPDKPDLPKFKLDLPVDTFVVRGLDGPLAQVFRNVIENAVSFSPKNGEIRIAATPVDGRAIITIDDQGPGIPEENLETVFRRFYTERPPSHGFGKNSGLGLSISRQIVEVHGGRIFAVNIRDDAGKVTGARFTIELPLAPQS
ncbi:MAG: HAMP domain-containing protein [Alphaproteobacteria bacterium]|nr:HAMP domain-containing protein [Alphaproteobacteria bacterium]